MGAAAENILMEAVVTIASGADVIIAVALGLVTAPGGGGDGHPNRGVLTVVTAPA
ncbi:MAG: hypothetical protein MZV63_68270 [Marinilabiliales bacterium]|nr:hypothetical protein [Marinilabiliales bacterium]